MLHLIATSGDLRSEPIHSLPTVQFSNQAILPIDRLPKGLRETFAWLEYFFEHPTLRPVLELVEHFGTGKVGPLLMRRSTCGNPYPSQRLQHFAVERDEDIALLWMAAVGDFAPLTDGILDRFAKPDAATLAQMRDEIFDSIQSRGKSGGRSYWKSSAPSRTLVARAAIAGDYWVAGSVAASASSENDDLNLQDIVAKRNDPAASARCSGARPKQPKI